MSGSSDHTPRGKHLESLPWVLIKGFEGYINKILLKGKTSGALFLY